MAEIKKAINHRTNDVLFRLAAAAVLHPLPRPVSLGQHLPGVQVHHQLAEREEREAEDQQGMLCRPVPRRALLAVSSAWLLSFLSF